MWPNQVFMELKTSEIYPRNNASKYKLCEGMDFTFLYATMSPALRSALGTGWGWGAHSITICWVNTRRMKWAYQHLFFELHDLNLVFCLTLTISLIKDSSKLFIKRGICRLGMTTYCKAIHSLEIIVLIRAFFPLWPTIKLRMCMKELQILGGSWWISVHIPHAFFNLSHKI